MCRARLILNSQHIIFQKSFKNFKLILIFKTISTMMDNLVKNILSEFCTHIKRIDVNILNS